MPRRFKKYEMTLDYVPISFSFLRIYMENCVKEFSFPEKAINSKFFTRKDYFYPLQVGYSIVYVGESSQVSRVKYCSLVKCYYHV